MGKNKNKSKNPFKYTEINNSLFRNNPKFDINLMYERVVEELGLQQTKRDQLITIYLAAFAFIVPPMLSSENNNWNLNGAIFIGLGIIGLLFALIIIRYRKYKEIYWHCCRTLNVMMDVDEENWSKENIQCIFYNCMLKKVSSYIENGQFNKYRFIKSNIFSSETMYVIIHNIISTAVLGFGVGILVPFGDTLKYTIGISVALIVFVIIMYFYFRTLIKVYQVCADKTDESFNDSFKDAWFLHFFITRNEDKKS